MLILVSELFHPDEVSTAPIMTEVAEHLSGEGELKVFAGPIGYEQSYSLNKGRILNEKIMISRVKIPSLDKNKLFTRIVRLLLLSFKLAYKVFKEATKEDHVIAVTNPAFLIILLSFLKRIKGYKLSIIVHDVFPENILPAGMAKEDSLKYKVLKKIYDKTYSKADNLIVLGKDMEELMRKKLGDSCPSIKVIPNWADQDIVPLPGFDKVKYLRVPVQDKIVIGFAGNLGRLQGLIEFLEVWKNVDNDDLALIIIGDGAVKMEMEAFIENNNLKNVFMLGSKPRREQISFLNACDLGLVSLKKGMFGLGIPSKTYNILAAGKPILFVGDTGSEIDNYVRSFGCGWSFNWDNTQDLTNFLENIDSEKSENYKRIGKKGLEVAREIFTREKILPLFSKL